jgi:Domain of unknown function (DUF5666)
MTTKRSYLAMTVAAALLSLAAVAWAGGELSVSGTVTSIDPANGILVVTEMGPWTITKGETVMTRRTFVLTARTEFARVSRSDSPAPTGWTGDFVEAPAAPDQLRPGDFVTVEVERDGSRLIARRVTLVELSKS